MEVHGRDSLVKRNVTQGRPHDPVVYTMPRHTEVVQPQDLNPVEVRFPTPLYVPHTTLARYT